MRLSLLLRALSTVLHWWGLRVFPALGHYVPYKFASSCVPLREEEAVGWLAERMDADLPRYLAILEQTTRYNERLAEIETAAGQGAGRPRFDQHWFTGLDAAVAYALVRERQPRRVVEVGSGHSTRFLAQAIADAGAPTSLVSIDPAPRRDIDALCDEVHRTVSMDAPGALFAELEAGDLLFVDGSHVAIPGSDVDHLFTRVLPGIAAGVLVHVHDVFLPNGYPRDWPWSDYSEHLPLLAMLGGGGRYRILCANAYLRRHHPLEAARVRAPRPDGARESSLWLEITA